MCKEYVVTFLNLDTNRVGHDLFDAESEADARSSFRACYRHATYKVLSVVLTGRDI